jgi:RHS repeat-associated protein
LVPVYGIPNPDPDDLLSAETYDQNGNVTAEGGKTFTYDSQNQLVSGGAVQIVYDGDGNRVAKTVNGVTTRYLVDDLNPTGYAQVVDELAGGAVTRAYTYGLQRISQDQVISNTWTPSFYGYDGGGNVRTLTSTAGAITDSYEYDAFGNLLTPMGPTPNEMLYRGEQYDPDLGLYYLRARYYNPTTGRFMGRDPEKGHYTNPASLHKYLYANGDPVNGSDPAGKSTVAEDLQLGVRALSTAAGLMAEAAAITCTLDLAASELAAVVNQYKIVGIDWPSCTAKTSNECAELRQEIYEFMNLINEKIDDLLIDNCDLYNQAFDIVNPSLPGACGKTTWVGHQQQVRDLQQGLRNRLEEAEKKGCPIPPGAWALATRPVPNQPRGN